MEAVFASDELALRSLKIGAIKLRPENPFTWASGLRMPIYNDNRLHISYPENRELILQLAISQLTEVMEFDGFLAIPSEGIWLAALLAAYFEMPLIIPHNNEFLVSNPKQEKKVNAQLKFDAVASTYPMALPVATLYADANEMPLVYIRPEKKGHGVGKQIEGNLTNIERVLLFTNKNDMFENDAHTALRNEKISVFNTMHLHNMCRVVDTLPEERLIAVEGLISTGGSSLKEITKASKAGAIIDDCLSIFSYDFPSAHAAFEKVGVQMHPILTYPQMLEVAFNNNLLSVYQKEMLNEWYLDHEGWGAKNGFPKVEKSTVWQLHIM